MDKFSATWLSYSSISTFQKCPRAYYLGSVYRDPRSGHKIALTTPPMALGSAVHQVLESIASLPTPERFKVSLIEKFQSAWDKVTGQKGGFGSDEEEARYKQKGEEMLRRVMAHPGVLEQKAVRIKGDLPNYWLSEDDGLILCGKLDWLIYQESTNSVHILDFKTGAGEESPTSLQLPIYYLLASNCQTREVTGASYWYIARDDYPREQPLPDLDKSHELVLKVGKEIKLARSLERFKCPAGEGGCRHCQPYEAILSGKAVFVGTGDYGADTYALFDNSALPESEIL